MSEEMSFTDLPAELIVVICRYLSGPDVCRLSGSNRRFHDILTNDNNVCRKVFKAMGLTVDQNIEDRIKDKKENENSFCYWNQMLNAHLRLQANLKTANFAQCRIIGFGEPIGVEFRSSETSVVATAATSSPNLIFKLWKDISETAKESYLWRMSFSGISGQTKVVTRNNIVVLYNVYDCVHRSVEVAKLEPGQLKAKKLWSDEINISFLVCVTDKVVFCGRTNSINFLLAARSIDDGHTLKSIHIVSLKKLLKLHFNEGMYDNSESWIAISIRTEVVVVDVVKMTAKRLRHERATKSKSVLVQGDRILAQSEDSIFIWNAETSEILQVIQNLPLRMKLQRLQMGRVLAWKSDDVIILQDLEITSRLSLSRRLSGTQALQIQIVQDVCIVLGVEESSKGLTLTFLPMKGSGKKTYRMGESFGCLCYPMFFSSTSSKLVVGARQCHLFQFDDDLQKRETQNEDGPTAAKQQKL